MSAFQTVTTTQTSLDPYKRVRYSMGLVLGVDEFEQEQFYFLNRNRMHHRMLHGYGTVCGLHVTDREEGEGVEIEVSAGVAIDPMGREIRVPGAQCARIPAWLQNRRTELEDRFGTAPALLDLYVVLCYRECETDQVPVPGGPCRSQEDSVMASRIADDFELSLRLDPPAQPQEEMTRRFGELLRRMQIADEATSYLSQEEVEALVLALLEDDASPPASPPLGSPPIGSPPLEESYFLRPEEACDLLQAAFRTWVTQVRPQVMVDCAAGNPEEQCVLLAEVQVPLGNDWAINGQVTVDDANRPLLASTRLLQEWLLCGRAFHREARTIDDFASLAGLTSEEIRIWIHHPALLDFDDGALQVEINGQPVQILDLDRVVDGVNVFDALLGPGEGGLGEGEALIEDRDRISVIFDTQAIFFTDDPARILYDEIIADQLDYVGRDGEAITVHAFAGFIPDHGQLDGLEDDDHPQYFNQERGDARYARRNHTHNLGDLRNVQDEDAQEGTRRDRDVLTWNEEARQWEPRRAQGGEIPDHEHTLNSLRDVNAPQPRRGSLIAFDGNQWAPQPTGQLSQGSALIWNGQQWTAQRIQQPQGNFVIAPLPQYAIIAAGIFGEQGDPRRRPYNDLQADLIDSGTYLLRFPGFVFSEEITYIVKGTIIERDQGEMPAIFMAGDFNDAGIIVRIYANREPAERPFMVEISVYAEDLAEVLDQIR